MQVLSILNTKGGVGKTVTAVHLGSALAKAGRQVLLVDIDLQHGLTSYFNVAPEGGSTTSDVLLRGHAVADAARPVRDNLSLIPATSEMESTDLALASARGGEVRLRSAFKNASGFDFVLIDCPSGWGTVTRNALLASSGLIVPVNSAAMAVPPAVDTDEGTRELAEFHEHEIALVGVLLTCYRSTNAARAVESTVCRQWGEKVFDTRVRKAEKMEELAIARATIGDVSRSAAGAVAQDYERLAEEVLSRCAMRPSAMETSLCAPKNISNIPKEARQA